ncbi:MAG: indolepyruvate ferredoxin oxidoreductase subunit alpha [Desulfurococcales archaeon]|nr:indolepyruvate ferredoxin oxidoreductase subunit alpha [Desulfurococcales archaeon]
MASKHKLLAPSGTTRLLMGNEAIARGAIEAGVGFVAGYPGTPSTEIIETLATVAKDLGIHVEWSTNEKVALEAVYGAQLTGVRSMATMKHVGLNVAADPFMTLAYTGVIGGTVVVSADDPNMWSSQNEQDNRYFGLKAYVPVFEPSEPGEAKELVKLAFQFSEEVGHPVLFRSTTRISHVRGPVVFGETPKNITNKGVFKKHPERFTVIPAHARKLRGELIERWETIKEKIPKLEPFNRIENPGHKTAILASGLAYAYTKESLRMLGIENKVTLVKIATPVPVPEEQILQAAENAEKILIVEELEPVVEMQVKNLLYNVDKTIEIHGKDYVPLIGELTLNKVLNGVARIVDLKFSVPSKRFSNTTIKLPPRPPAMCPGCPHRGTFYSLRRAVNKARVKPVYSGDIGCYSLGVLPPFREQDTIIEMGGSIGLANGFAHTLEKQVPIAIIGDSTFFHSGVTGLINAVYNSAPQLIIVLDNRVTAMTGEQPNPGTGINAVGDPAPLIKIEDIAKAVGVEYVDVFDPFEIKDGTDAMYKALKYVLENKKPALVIAKRACALEIDRVAKRKGVETPMYQVISEKCTACGVCYNAFTCPAIMVEEDGKAVIDESLCTGCGVCAEVCPFDAIVKTRDGDPEWYELWNI